MNGNVMNEIFKELMGVGKTTLDRCRDQNNILDK
jgi:hypothetical protein